MGFSKCEMASTVNEFVYTYINIPSVNFIAHILLLILNIQNLVFFGQSLFRI
jgi:hypothetical protein